ncbi:MAG: glycosyltransferase family 9 protein [bacterium]
MSTHNHILVVRNGAIGDTVLLTPVLYGLRLAFPDHEIVLLGRYERVNLLVGPSFATRAFSFDQPGIHTLYGPQPALPPETHSLFATAELILWYGEDEEGQLQRNLKQLCPGQVLLRSPRGTGREHITEHLLQSLDRIGVPKPDSVPPLEVSRSMPTDLEDLLSGPKRRGGLVVVHPGAGSVEKRLAPRIWAGVLLTMSRPDEFRVVVLSGPEEERLGIELCEHACDLGPLLIHNRPLPDVAALLGNTDLFLGHDSGITHLAAAVGCRTVAVFRSTDPRVWAPRGEHVRVVEIREEADALDLIISGISQ